MIFWVIWIIFISILNLTVIFISSSTCSNDKNSMCTKLPFNISKPPDIWFNIPSLNIDEISFVGKDLKAHVSVSANVANVVSLNAGVDVSVSNVNLIIKGKHIC